MAVGAVMAAVRAWWPNFSRATWWQSAVGAVEAVPAAKREQVEQAVPVATPTATHDQSRGGVGGPVGPQPQGGNAGAAGPNGANV